MQYPNHRGCQYWIEGRWCHCLRGASLQLSHCDSDNVAELYWFCISRGTWASDLNQPEADGSVTRSRTDNKSRTKHVWVNIWGGSVTRWRFYWEENLIDALRKYKYGDDLRDDKDIFKDVKQRKLVTFHNCEDGNRKRQQIIKIWF